MTTITTENVKKIAQLVKLEVSGQEVKLAKMFTETLDYIDVLDGLDTKGTPETYQVTGLTNVFQQTGELAQPTTLTVEQTLSNARSKSRNLIETKGVFDR